MKAKLDTFNEEKALEGTFSKYCEYRWTCADHRLWMTSAGVWRVYWALRYCRAWTGDWGMLREDVLTFHNILMSDPANRRRTFYSNFLSKEASPPSSPYARVIEIDASKKVKQNFVASLTFQFNFYRVWTGTYQIICLLLLCNTGLGDDSTNTDTKEETLVRVSSVVTPNIAPGLSTRAWN